MNVMGMNLKERGSVHQAIRGKQLFDSSLPEPVGFGV